MGGQREIQDKRNISIVLSMSLIFNKLTNIFYLHPYLTPSCPGWMHETSARGWYTGKTQRDGVGREAGGGIGMGNTCKSMVDS